VSGQVPCSGAERQDKVLDEVSTAIHGGEAAMNASFTSSSGERLGWKLCHKISISFVIIRRINM